MEYMKICPQKVVLYSIQHTQINQISFNIHIIGKFSHITVQLLGNVFNYLFHILFLFLSIYFFNDFRNPRLENQTFNENTIHYDYDQRQMIPQTGDMSNGTYPTDHSQVSNTSNSYLLPTAMDPNLNP